MLSQKCEDYLEAILMLVEKKGYARPRDIARRMQVKPPSVTEMLGKLRIEGYVNYEKYGEVTLTPAGLSEARKVRCRHEVFEKLLTMLLVPPEIASEDACVLEHHIHKKTEVQLSRFVKFVEGFQGGAPFLKNFAEYCKSGKMPKCPKSGRRG
jgi:DtxR family transcriptional regulator, Mn-dependent transcriptional regulator